MWALADRCTEEQIEAAIRAYEVGESARSVARQLGISKSGLLGLLRGRGVTVRPRTRLTAEHVAEAAVLYESGLLLREIADRFDVSTECVRKRLVEVGVTMRPVIGGRAGGLRRRG